MTTNIQITVTPDSSLSLSTETRTIALQPTDYQAMIVAYTASNGYLASQFTTTDGKGQTTYSAPTHAQFVTALLTSMFTGVSNNVVSYVQAQKLAQVTTSGPSIVIS